MRVLHFTLSFHHGGRRRAIESLASSLRQLDVSCALACLDELGCPLADIDGLFGEVMVLNRKRLLDRGAIRKLADFCRKREIDVIHTHDAASQFVAALVRLRHRRPRLLMTFHRSLPIESARRRDRLRNAFATAMSQAVVVGSTERRRHFLEENYVPSAKVVRIPFGIDVETFCPSQDVRNEVRRELGIADGASALGVVGHFGDVKGVDLAVQAFNNLMAQRPGLDAELIVCGDGNDNQRRRLHSMVGSHGRVKFLGHRRDMHRLFQAFDVLVHPPRIEAFGLVLIEAMASGLPVVATRVGGIPDIVQDGITGLLVDPATEPLAAGVLKCIVDADLRQKLGAAGRIRAVDEYNVGLYAARHRRLYENLLAGRPPRGADLPYAEADPRVDSRPSLPHDV